MIKYVIVDLKTNADFEKKYHLPIGYSFYEEVIFSDFEETMKMYHSLVQNAPEGVDLNGIVIEMHKCGEKKIIYDYKNYKEEYKTVDE